jgi:hypothetical protein
MRLYSVVFAPMLGLEHLADRSVKTAIRMPCLTDYFCPSGVICLTEFERFCILLAVRDAMTKEQQTKNLKKLERADLLKFTRRLGFTAHKMHSNDELIALIVRMTDGLHGRAA